MVILTNSHMELDGMKILAQPTQLSKENAYMEEVVVMMDMLHSHACSQSKLLKNKDLRCQESAWFLRLKKNLEVQI
jgi:hypothetical protein